MTDRREQEVLSALMDQRKKIYDLAQVRKAMGGFDANADAVQAILGALSAILDYEITMAVIEKKRR